MQRSLAKRLLRYGLYPLTLTAGLLSCWLLSQAGIHPALSVTGPVLVVAIGLGLLERRAPMHEAWRPGLRHWWLDLLHSLVTTAGTSKLMGALLLGGLHTLSLWLQPRTALAWPTNAPLWLQCIGALVVAEFGTYWAHRAYHELPAAWRIHAAHHTVERMHSLAAGRNHPFNVAITFLVATAPLVVLGVPAPVLAVLNVFTGINGLLQHANVDLRLGPLNWIFAGPELHHMHHSRVLDESNANYGSNLIVWDVLFGTRLGPLCHPARAAVGLNEASLPENFFTHMTLPFVYNEQTARHHRDSLIPRSTQHPVPQTNEEPPWHAHHKPTPTRPATAS